MIRCNDYGKTTTIAPTTTTAPATKTTTPTTTTTTEKPEPTTTTTKKPEPTTTEPYDVCDDFEPPVSISQGPFFYAKKSSTYCRFKNFDSQ